MSKSVSDEQKSLIMKKTPIAVELEDQIKHLKNLKKNWSWMLDDIKKTRHVIRVLRSLLDKEKNELMEAFLAGNGDQAITPQQYFDQTYENEEA